MKVKFLLIVLMAGGFILNGTAFGEDNKSPHGDRPLIERVHPKVTLKKANKKKKAKKKAHKAKKKAHAHKAKAKMKKHKKQKNL